MKKLCVSEQRRKNMKAIRSKNTTIEIKVASALRSHGIRARRNVENLFGKPDFAIKKYKIAIFIDSCFWHGCTEHGRIPNNNRDYWVNKILRNQIRDKEVTHYYLSIGWNILRIWEHDLKNDFDGTIKKIVDFIIRAKDNLKKTRLARKQSELMQ